MVVNWPILTSLCIELTWFIVCCSQREQEEREERWAARRQALEGAQRDLEREWGAQWREWAEAIAVLESRQRELRSRRRVLEQERRDEMTQVSYLIKYEFYLILVALGVLIYLSGNIIIYSHVCPLDMWRKLMIRKSYPRILFVLTTRSKLTCENQCNFLNRLTRD